MINLKLNYNINQNSTVGMIADVGKHTASSVALNETTFEAISSNSLYDSKRDLVYNYEIANVYFDHNLDQTGKALNLSFNYLDRKSDDNWKLINQASDINGVKTTSGLGFKIYTSQADVILPYANFSIESGIKHSTFLNTSNINYLILSHSLQDANIFKYDENNFAAYASIEKKWRKNLTTKIGVRYEYSHISLESNNQTFRYHNLFPSLYMQYEINSDNVISASYSRRIDRPSSQHFKTVAQFGHINFDLFFRINFGFLVNF